MESDPNMQLRISPRSTANHDRVKKLCDLAENQSSAEIVQVSKRVRLEDESASSSEAPKTPDITELPRATDENSENGENEEIDKIVSKYSLTQNIVIHTTIGDSYAKRNDKSKEQHCYFVFVDSTSLSFLTQ